MDVSCHERPNNVIDAGGEILVRRRHKRFSLFARRCQIFGEITNGGQFPRGVALDLVQNNGELTLAHVSAVHEHVSLRLLLRRNFQFTGFVDTLSVIAQIEGSADLEVGSKEKWRGIR